MLELSEKEVIQEIMKAEELSKNVIETGCRLFRIPYGESNEKLTQLLQEKVVVSIKWTIDSMDWKGIRPEEIFDNVVRNDDLGNGAIILMHNSGEHTAEALDLIIPALSQRGYELVEISDLLKSVPFYRRLLK